MDHPAFFRLQKLPDRFSAVAIYYDRTLFDLLRAIGFVIIQAGVNCVLVFIRHLPERILHDHGCVGSDADLQEKHMESFVPFKEIGIGS